MANKQKQQSIIQALLIVGILIFLNVLGNFIYFKFDLTEEKRFTLTEPTIQLLENVDNPIDVTILLDGDFPAGFKRLQTATKEMLDDFRSVTGWLEYNFDDPNAGTPQEVAERHKVLDEMGIKPTRLQIKSADKREDRSIYPYAIINYRGKVSKVNLLENDAAGMSDKEVLNNSVSLLEYKLANAIKRLESGVRPVIVYTTGHGELTALQMADIRKTLFTHYDMGEINLDSVIRIDPKIDVLMIPKPRFPFSEKDFFKIDQYVMNGGKVLWMVDMLNVHLDSLAVRGTRPFIPSENLAGEGLNNLLYKYGVRMRPGNLIFDVENSRIPLQVGVTGNAPQFELFPWFYHPTVTPKSDHPVVKGLDRVNFFFPTAIDTSVIVPTDLRKTVLLSSSEFSRIKPNTSRISFDDVMVDPKNVDFSSPYQPIAVLLEGTFPSAYRNRVSSEMAATLSQIGSSFQEESVDTRMIVISDGDVIKNPVNPQTSEYMPLGYNKYENYTFANKAFLVNCLEYLMDDQGVVEARSKEVKLRLLNVLKAGQEKTKWQLINIVLPVVLLILFGLVYNYIRRRRFAA